MKKNKPQHVASASFLPFTSTYPTANNSGNLSPTYVYTPSKNMSATQSYYKDQPYYYPSTGRAGYLSDSKVKQQSPLYQTTYNRQYRDVKKIPQQYSSLRQTFDSRGNNRIRDMISKFDNSDEKTNDYEPKVNFSKYDNTLNSNEIQRKQKFRNYELEQKLKKYTSTVDQFSAQLQSTKKMSQQIKKLKQDRKKRLQAIQRQNQQTKLSSSYSSGDLTKYQTPVDRNFSKGYGEQSFLKPLDKQAFKRKKSEYDTYVPEYQKKYIKNSSSFNNQYNYLKDSQKQKQLKKQLNSYTQKYKFKDTNTDPISAISSVSSTYSSYTNKTLQELMNKKEEPIQYVQINNFILRKNLGEGKFGVVYRAVHKPTGWLFAIKKVPKQMITSHLMIDQFILELKLQAYLNHENILTLYTQFDDKSHIYIVLQYMQQGTLFSLLKKNKVLPEQQTAVKIKQIASAVKYLQDNQIAHRDIKPQNIVMSHGVCKLCDFGWATICDERRKTYCGTFDYAPPQILEGHQYDFTVDLWCLGVLTYQLLVGKAPFYHISRKQTMKKILNVEFTQIQYPKNVSKTAIQFIESLIKKDPKQRLSSQLLLEHPFLKYADKTIKKY